MLLITYDIQQDRLRTQLSNFLKKYGRRIQYSVFEVENSKRTLENIKVELDCRFSKKFSQADSVFIFDLGKGDKTLRYGYSANEESDLLIWH